MIDESNFKRALTDYAFEKYGKKLNEFFEKFREDFPEKDEEMEKELYYMNFMEWLIIEKSLPETGKTIVEEFVEAHPELDKSLKEKMLQMRNIVRSRFIILSKEGARLKMKDENSGKEYYVALQSENPELKRGVIIEGRIHPFGNYYRFAGAFKSFDPYPYIPSVDVMMEMLNEDKIKKAESIILYENTKMTAILNKYPSQWVDGMCNALSISTRGKKDDKVKMIARILQENLQDILKKLPEKSKKALRLVLEKGGFVKEGVLKDYDDEIGFWWNDKPPKSDIGLLRLHGLLVVGRMPVGGRMFSTAFVPSDLRELLKKELGKK